MVCTDTNNSAAISAAGQVAGQQRQDAQLGRCQRRRPGTAGTALPGQLGPQRLGLADQGAQVWSPPEQLIDLPHQRPGPGQVGQREVHAGKLDPGLDGQMGDRVGQQMPQPLSRDEFPAHRRDVSPVQGYPGLRGAEQGHRMAVLDPGPDQHAACLRGQGLGPAPFTACHRHQRSLAQREREGLGRADFLQAADRGLQRRVAAVPVTAQDARDPLQKRGRRYHEALLGAPAHGLVGVGAHLLGPAAA